jgi:hypothetical protein
MTHCLTCGAALDPDWCDVYCPTPCLEQVYERLAQELLTGIVNLTAPLYTASARCGILVSQREFLMRGEPFPHTDQPS